jgi:hypothetical protein
MALSNVLAEQGTPPTDQSTSVTITFVPGSGITASRIEVEGQVPGIDADAFDRDAARRWGSRTFAIAGPTFTFEDGTVMGTGRWAAPIEGTGWSIVTGNITFGQEVGPHGFALVVDYRGHATQICDLLA